MRHFLKKRFYITISKYLKTTDGNPTNISKNDDFVFHISCTNFDTVHFSFYESLACFQSKNGLQQLKAKQCYLEIKYQTNILPSIQVKEQLINLLSGKPIIIDQNNFPVFQEVSCQLETPEFDLFFGFKTLNLPTEFYLSIYSLKNTNNSILESKVYEIKYEKKTLLKIPIGICNLFFSDPKSSQPNSQKILKPEQIEEGLEFLLHFSKVYFDIPNETRTHFLSFY
jgi:hypothetical protein